MLQVADELRRAGIVDTVPSHLPIHPLDRLLAGWADRGRLPGLFRSITHINDRADHIRDHFSGALDQHPVTYPDILFQHVIKVVQGGLLHDHPPNFDGFEYSVGSQYARSGQRSRQFPAVS